MLLKLTFFGKDGREKHRAVSVDLMPFQEIGLYKPSNLPIFSSFSILMTPLKKRDFFVAETHYRNIYRGEDECPLDLFDFGARTHRHIYEVLTCKKNIYEFLLEENFTFQKLYNQIHDWDKSLSKTERLENFNIDVEGYAELI